MSHENVMKRALAALMRVQPQVRGAIPAQDVEFAIADLRTALAEKEKAEPRRELSEREERQHTHEARRWCHGDSAWSEWQPCTAEQALSYAKDETFQVRAAKG